MESRLDSASLFLARNQRDQASAAVENVRNQAAIARSELLELLGLLPDAPVELAIESTGEFPELLEPDCRSPRQMRWANAVCRFRELASVVEIEAMRAGEA